MNSYLRQLILTRGQAQIENEQVKGDEDNIDDFNFIQFCKE